MARGILRTALWLLQFGVVFNTLGIAADTPQSPVATDEHAESRKLDAAFSFLRRRNAEAYAVTSPDGINEARYVSIGGIEQWVTIRGQHRDNPVLLFLHGGPGDCTNPWAFALFAPWQEPFTIVQWDQRGAGRTLGRNGPSIGSTITLDRVVNDGIELAEYLRAHLGKDKIIVVGHSFGSIVGVRMARARPDLFFAFVGTGQVGDGARNFAVAYDALIAKARSAGNRQALEELTQIGPPQIGRPPHASGRGFAVQRKWANAFEGADQFIYGAIGLALVSPETTVRDINDWFDGQNVSAEHLASETAPLGPKDLGLDFAIPIFVFQGAEDFTTPTALARQYVASIKARRKAFVSIDGGGHFAVFMKSDRFLKELTTRVRPLAVE